MVMRNRNEGSDTPHWWDDLPPKVRNRFSKPPSAEDLLPEPAAPAVSRGELLGDLSRLAGMFFLIAIGNILFLLVALFFLHG
jgi:hypothetical protein